MCCTNDNDRCDTCKWSHGEDDIRCYCPLIYLNPPQDAEWEQKEIKVNDGTPP